VNTKLGSVPDTSATSRAATSTAQPFPWPAATATGIGSMPGTSAAEAAAVVLGELPDFPYLPELPGRGPGSDLTGRTAGLLVDMPVETGPRGWRFALRPGRDQRRAAGLLAEDLDVMQEAADGYAGPFKIQLAGPWTMAATVELNRSQNPALADPGAVADLIASLAEGVAAHAAEVRNRLPAATVVLQLDEPALPAVLAGAVPTASGLNRVGAVDTAVTGDGLRAVLTAGAAFSVVHCCAPDYPFGMIKDSGARAISFDAQQLGPGAEDQIAELAEAGMGILAGVLDTRDTKRMITAASPAPKELAGSVIELWHRAGLPPATLAGQVVITPACGLAGFSPASARAALASCHEAARILPELAAERSS
jgi:methionine synthase II (cobalamin-independent)